MSSPPLLSALLGSPLRSLCLLALLALSGAGCGARPMPASSPSPLLNQPAPAFQRPTTGGDRLAIETLKGKVVVVKFFAKYCEPCQRTLPAAERLHRANPDIIFVGIAEDESSDDIQEQVRRYGLTFPIIHDRQNVLIGRFRTSEMPATFVLDRQGVVRWVGGGSQAESDLEAAIGALQSSP